MKFVVMLMTAVMLCAASIHAQERTAGGAMDTQMTWSALSSKITTVSEQTKALDTRVIQIGECGKQGKLYAPGADSDNCKAVADQKALKIVGGGQCLTPEGGSSAGKSWMLRNGWGAATVCDTTGPRCKDSTILNLGYGNDRMSEGEVSNFCKYHSSLNECHTQTFLCVQDM